MKILILTGNGALVGASFYNEVIDTLHKTYNKIYDNEYPEIILYNLPLNMNEKGELEDNQILKNKLLGFNNLDIDYLFVLCNSISEEIESITKEIEINYKFINIIENTKNKINEKAIILCSNFTNKYKIYGNEFVYLKEDEQLIIDKIIDSVLKGNNLKKSLCTLKVILEKYNETNIILGCTELYFIKNYFDTNKYYIYDSLSLYKDRLINIINKGI